jgi:hypothetical protein
LATKANYHKIVEATKSTNQTMVMKLQAILDTCIIQAKENFGMCKGQGI